MMQLSVMMRKEHEPLIFCCTDSMPSSNEAEQVMIWAMSSVGLVLPELSSVKFLFWESISFSSASMLQILPTVTMANRPRCELTTMGCASVSLITPMPMLPVYLYRSSSNFTLK